MKKNLITFFLTAIIAFSAEPYWTQKFKLDGESSPKSLRDRLDNDLIQKVSTVNELATVRATEFVYLTEDGREGLFRWDASATNAADGGIYFTNSATGRWIRQLNGQLPTPEMFGAAGDNATDDYAALQAALNTGKSVRLSADKIYLTTQPLTFTASYQFLKGDSRGTSRINAGTSDMTVLGNATGGLLNQCGVIDVCFGCASNVVAGIAVDLYNVTDATVERCYITGDSDQPTDRGFVAGIRIYGTTPLGSYCNRIYNNFITTYKTNISFGILGTADASGYGPNSSSLIGNRIRAGLGTGISFRYASGPSAKDNTIEGSTRLAIELTNGTHYAFIHNNRLEVDAGTNLVGVAVADDCYLNQLDHNFYDVVNYLQNGYPIIPGTGTGNDFIEPALGAVYDKRFGGKLMLNAPNVYGPAHNPRGTLDINIPSLNTTNADQTATIIFGRGDSAINPLRIAETRKQNYYDKWIGRNMDGTTNADTYFTPNTASSGWSGIEFRYPGSIAFYGTNGNTTADTVVTPTMAMLFDTHAGYNDLRMMGAREGSTAIQTDKSFTFTIGETTSDLVPGKIGITRRNNYQDFFVGKNLVGTNGADTYHTAVTSSTGGYGGIEFRYPGSTAFYGTNGATTAAAAVTPVMWGIYDARVAEFKLFGSKEAGTGTQTAQATTFTFGESSANVPSGKLGLSRRQSYWDTLIGKNLVGTNGSDLYLTEYTSTGGYASEEFRYGGEINYYATNGTTTAGQVVTPNLVGQWNRLGLKLPLLRVYTNNAAAIAGGLTAGQLYRTGADPDAVCVVH